MLNRIPSSCSRRRTSRGAFTLIEILVVVAIIAVLIAIIIPALGAARKFAKKSATLAGLNSLQTALSAYANDFQGAYPASHDTLIPTTPNFLGKPYNSHMNSGRGSAMLAEGLMGYLPGTDDHAGPDPAPPAAPTSYLGDPRFGFRMHAGQLGRIYGPYASDNPKNYHVNITNVTTLHDEVFIDPYGNEILYFRSSYTSSTLASTTTFPNVVFGPYTASNPAPNPMPYFIDTDNQFSLDPTSGLPVPRPLLPSAAGGVTTKFFQALGVAGNGAAVASNNITPVTGANPTLLSGKDSYILISAGDDGIFYNDDDIIVTKP